VALARDRAVRRAERGERRDERSRVQRSRLGPGETVALDPDVQRQTIEVTVNPNGMPRAKAVSLVTIVADHGERRVLTIETQRQIVPGGAKTVSPSAVSSSWRSS
jgi:hypothetical protein